jgi:hypothetical protein
MTTALSIIAISISVLTFAWTIACDAATAGRKTFPKNGGRSWHVVQSVTSRSNGS